MADKRRLVPEDLYKLAFVSDPQISPCGKLIAFTKTVIDEKTKEYRSHIYVTPFGSREAKQFTSGPKSDTNPRWSPDGTKLAFLSDRGSGRQIYVMPTNGGEAYPVTKMRRGAGTPVWSPDGTKIAFAASVDSRDKPEELEKPLDQKTKEAEEKQRKDEPTVINRVRMKADMAMGLLPNRRSHIFVIDAEGKGPVTQITSGDFDHRSPVWSPDGKYLAFVANRDPEADWEPWHSDIFVVPAEGGELRKLTPSKGPSAEPRWTPDGKYLVYAGNQRENGAVTLGRLWKVPVEGGEPVLLTGSFDRSVGPHAASDSKFGSSEAGPAITPDGKTIYFISSDSGRSSVYSVPVEGGDVSPVLGGDRDIYGLTMDDSGKRLALAVSEPVFPGDIYSYDLSSKEEKRLTEVNKDLLDEVYIVSPETVPFKAKDGLMEYGWIMKPAGYKQGVKYPAILEIHGGPHSMYGYSFFFEFQLLCNMGYIVFYTNPRGGEGFGQEFVKAVVGDYGGMDYDDLMTWTDVALESGIIDKDRMGVTGGSYGGFMTNWIVGHTDRFAAAVTQRSISNWISFHGVSDIGYTFTNRELDAEDPWKDFDKLWKFSPLAYVENVKTPILIIHSEQDMRCPIEQGEQFYVALRKMKKEAEMARFPGANHELSRGGRPVLRVERLKQILRWFDGHISKRPEEYDPAL